MKTRVEKSQVLYRMLDQVKVEQRQEEGKSVLRFSASSEQPVQRWFGKEILSHEADAVRMERIRAGAVPLLFNHNSDDVRGMVDAGSVERKRLVVDAHTFDTEAGQELSRMIAGGLRNVSLAYRIYELIERVDEETFTATDWEPLEISIVSVPADPTVGIGRSDGQENEVRITEKIAASAARSKNVKDENRNTQAPAAEPTPAAAGNGAGARSVDVITPEPREPNAVEIERARKQAVANLCKANNLDDRYRDMWIGQGASLERVSDDLLRILEERGKTNPQPASRLGLSQPESQRFSLARAIVAATQNDWSKAGFELECSRAVADKLKKLPEPTKFYVPFDVLQRPVDLGAAEEMVRRLRDLGVLHRDLSAGVAGAGGFLVSTDNQGFIEMLRNRSVAFRMGARRLTGLQGNVTIPRQSAAGTAFWLSTEATAITESQQTFVQIALTAKTVGAYTEISRQLLLQSSPGAEGIVTDDLAQVVAIAVDLAVLEGSGAAGQPTGIANTPGIGSVSGTSLQYAGILEFQSDVASANVMPLRGGYVTTPAVAALLAARSRFANTDTPLWEGNIWDGRVAGFPGMSSNQPAAASMLFGDWQEEVVGEWGVLEVEVNPYANFQAGIIGVRALYAVDAALRRPFAFSRATSIT